MSSDEEAPGAMAALDGQDFEGKRIGVSPAPASTGLLPFGISPEPSEIETESGQPPARESAMAMLDNAA
jgi:hypothetical protein